MKKPPRLACSKNSRDGPEKCSKKHLQILLRQGHGSVTLSLHQLINTHTHTQFGPYALEVEEVNYCRWEHLGFSAAKTMRWCSRTRRQRNHCLNQHHGKPWVTVFFAGICIGDWLSNLWHTKSCLPGIGLNLRFKGSAQTFPPLGM